MKLFKALFLLLALLVAHSASAITLATDNFTGGDANPIGGNWTTLSSGPSALQRVSNAVQGTDTGSRNGAYYNAVSAPNDQWSSLVITAAGGGHGPCVVVRAAVGADSYYAFCPIDAGGDAFDLAKVVAGAYTSLSSDFSAWAPGDTIKIEAQGTTIRGFINGVEVASVTDSALASGQFGIVIGGESPLTNRVGDNWSGGDFTTAIRKQVIVID